MKFYETKLLFIFTELTIYASLINLNQMWVKIVIKDTRNLWTRNYSRIPNKQTGRLLHNENEIPPILFSPDKLKNPTYIPFISPEKYQKSSPLHIHLFGTTYICLFWSLEYPTKQTSPNFTFCFIKRAHHRILLQGLLQKKKERNDDLHTYIPSELVPGSP